MRSARERLAQLSEHHRRQGGAFENTVGAKPTDATRLAVAEEIINDMPELEVKLCQWLAGRGIERADDD